jgi:uncharacterized protein YbjT (DUF2867 family)
MFSRNIKQKTMKEKTATVIGATGLIGSHLVELLRNDDYYKTIRVLLRRPGNYDDPKIRMVVIDFSDPVSFKSAIAGSDAVFCAVGTTQKKVKGDKAAYRMVDYDIPVNAAQFCAETGCQHFLVVSSVGADSKTGNFYLKLKGEVEDRLKSIDIPSVSVFRPSILLGDRKEFRFFEIIAKGLSEFFSFLFPSIYKPIKAHTVAKAMITASRSGNSGFQIFHYKEMKKLVF